jgi:hypothetical protein
MCAALGTASQKMGDATREFIRARTCGGLRYRARPSGKPRLRRSFALPVQMARIKKLGQLGLAKRENLSYITLHKDSLYYPASQNGIANSIGAKGALTALFKAVFMYPSPIWTLDLFVDEPEWRFPDADPCSPLHGNAVNSNPVVDQCPDLHLNVTRRENFKMQPWRSHRSQVFGIGEKWKNLRWGRREPKLRGE